MLNMPYAKMMFLNKLVRVCEGEEDMEFTLEPKAIELIENMDENMAKLDGVIQTMQNVDALGNLNK